MQTTLGEKLAKFQAETEKQVKKLTKEHEVEQKVAALCPVKPYSIFHHDTSRETWVSFKADSLSEVQKIIEGFQSIPRVYFKNHSLSLEPREKYELRPENDKDKGDLREIFPYVFKIKTLLPYGSTCELDFFASLDGDLTRINIETRADLYRKAFSKSWRQKRNFDRTVENVELYIENEFYNMDEAANYTAERVRWWSTPEQPNDFSIYFQSNHQDPESFDHRKMILDYLERAKG